MEAGFDYLLANRRFRLVRLAMHKVGQNPLPYAGAALIAVGLTGVLVGSLFFFVFKKSTGELQEELTAVASPAPQTFSQLSQTRQATPGPTLPVVAVLPSQPAEGSSTLAVTDIAPHLASEAGLFPGEDLKPSYWPRSAAYVPAPPLEDVIGDFQPVTPAMVADAGRLPAPTRLLIPSINVESDVRQLRVLSFGNSSAWETPDNVVGHIPISANPGEAGSTWLFGHLESPIRGEGNVFGQLPEIASKLRRGDDVYAVVDNGSEEYLYRIVESKVVPQEQLRLTDDGNPQLFMVTCVPRFIYDHRLVVRGVLEGVKSSL